MRRKAAKVGVREFTVMLHPEPEGGFTVTVPALPGCVTYGRTVAEAKRMAADAIDGFLECLRAHGDPLPEGDYLITSVPVGLPG
jgi:predicted RNase H-like HicB family nuclease